MKYILLSVLIFLNQSFIFGKELYWPTEDDSFFQGAKIETLIQPTISGKVESGTFGYVRNNQTKFHEGIDIKPKKRNKKGEAQDKVIAAMDGQIMYINTIGGNSGYGKYIVIVHKNGEPSIYTLYAHLSNIEPSIKVGKFVQGGTVLGVMGRTAVGSHIPKERAHLHFEMGLMVSNDFSKWYKDQKMDSPNRHGIWNGFNLIGFDPLDFYEKWRMGTICCVKDYFKQLPVAFSLRVTTRKIPDFVTRYPSLVTERIKSKDLKGWDIDFTWFAMPFRWTPLYITNNTDKTEIVRLKNYDINIINENNAKDIIRIHNEKKTEYGKSLKRSMSLLFGIKNLT